MLGERPARAVRRSTGPDDRTASLTAAPRGLPAAPGAAAGARRCARAGQRLAGPGHLGDRGAACSARTSSSRCSGCCSSRPASYDLGIYTEYVKQLSQLHAPVVDMLGAGIQPARQSLPGRGRRARAVLPALPLAGDAAVLPGAVRRGVGVPGGHRRVSRSPGAATGRLIGFAYGFSWGLQQMIDFDFHEIALAVPLLAFSRLRAGPPPSRRRRSRGRCRWCSWRRTRASPWPRSAPARRGGVPVAAAAVAAARPRCPRRASAMSGRPRRATGPPGRGAAGCAGARPGQRRGLRRVALWGGLFLMAWGLFWSTFAITVIIPHFNPLHQYYFWKDGGAVGGGQAVLRQRAARPGGRRLAHQGSDARAAAAAHGVRRPRLAGRADRAAQPGAAVHLDRTPPTGARPFTTTRRSCRSCSSRRPRPSGGGGALAGARAGRRTRPGGRAAVAAGSRAGQRPDGAAWRRCRAGAAPGTARRGGSPGTAGR